MLAVNQHDTYVGSRLLDFFSSGAPWQRRLWSVGVALGLREVLEGSEAVQSGVLAPASLKSLCHEIEILTGRDPGIGGARERQTLCASLRNLGNSDRPRAGSMDCLMIQEVLSRIEDRYLERWRDALLDPGSRPKPERTARGIATYLLDSGFSGDYLHRWWTYRITHEPGSRSLADLIADAQSLARQPASEFEILLAFSSVPGAGSDMPPNWRNPAEVSSWLSENDFDPRNVRQTGGFLLHIEARDIHAAVEHVSEVVERLSARTSLGTRSHLQPLPQVWVRGSAQPYPRQRASRGVEVRALVRENQLYKESATSNIDAALELVGALNEGPPGPAVAGGWAALEALLLGPGDGGHRGVAGDRLASLVACSFPRAELTALAYAHARKAKDTLALDIHSSQSNRERAGLVAKALLAGQPLHLSLQSDRVAEGRMRALLEQPRETLREVEEYACRALRRLYRQRNLVLHWGRMNAVCLRAALRTVAPLVGAGVDRIAHAWFANHRTNPLELAARAKIRLELLGTSEGISPVELLEP